MVLEADNVDEGDALEDPTTPTYRERSAATDRNVNLTTTTGVVPPVPPKNTTNHTLISEPRLFVPEIEKYLEEEDNRIE